MRTDVTPGAVGVDVGGTKIAAGYIGPDGRPIEVGVLPTTPGDGGANLAAVWALLRQPELSHAAVVGVSMATTIDEEGRLRDPHGWFGWRGRDLAQALSADGRTHVVIADAEAGAVGEHRFGAARGTTRPLYVTAGTGLAHAYLEEGRPLEGAHRSAYFSGYTTPARCAWERCDAANVERISSGTAIAEAYFGDARSDARQVFAAAAAGDGRAADVIEHAAWHLGVLIADLMLIYDPEAVVLGGGLGSGGPGYLERADAVAREHISVEHTRRIPLLRAQLGPASCWAGAAAIARVGGVERAGVAGDTEGVVLT
ncbi:ROK family protein [Leifsonia sp. LS-T14]|uniref:ROK family protein n=1 Tax=unclassified Leifsonia TaxID=2663824 RepID=UPI0035A6A27A